MAGISGNRYPVLQLYTQKIKYPGAGFCRCF